MYVYVYRSVYTLHLFVFDVPHGCSQDLIYKRLRQKRDELLGKEADYERSAGVFAKGGCCSKKDVDPAVIMIVNQQKLIIIMYQI